MHAITITLVALLILILPTGAEPGTSDVVEVSMQQFALAVTNLYNADASAAVDTVDTALGIYTNPHTTAVNHIVNL